MSQIVVLQLLAAAFIVASVSFIFTKQYVRKYLLIEFERDFEIKKSDFLKSYKSELKGDEGQIAILEKEYLRGKVDGAKEELAKFNVTLQPYTMTKEEYFGLKKRVEIGYEMQISYAQFPIGKPSRNITSSDEKYDQEKIDRLLNSNAMSAITNMAQALMTKGMTTSILSNPAKR